MFRLTQGLFSYLPNLNKKQIENQIMYAIGKRFALSVEHTEVAHPRNCYWEMWGLPLFDIKDPAPILREIAACILRYPNHYVKLNAFNNARGVESCALSFILHRPVSEKGFDLMRQESSGRAIRYTIISNPATHVEPNDDNDKDNYNCDDNFFDSSHSFRLFYKKENSSFIPIYILILGYYNMDSETNPIFSELLRVVCQTWIKGVSDADNTATLEFQYSGDNIEKFANISFRNIARESDMKIVEEMFKKHAFLIQPGFSFNQFLANVSDLLGDNIFIKEINKRVVIK